MPICSSRFVFVYRHTQPDIFFTTHVSQNIINGAPLSLTIAALYVISVAKYARRNVAHTLFQIADLAHLRQDAVQASKNLSYTYRELEVTCGGAQEVQRLRLMHIIQRLAKPPLLLSLALLIGHCVCSLTSSLPAFHSRLHLCFASCLCPSATLPLLPVFHSFLLRMSLFMSDGTGTATFANLQ